MKKSLFTLFILSFVLIGCNTQTEEPVDNRKNFVGTYLLSGEGTQVTIVTANGKTTKDVKEHSFEGKRMNIKLDPQNQDKLIIDWDWYNKTTATTINSYAISIENTNISFIDDGSFLGKGGKIRITETYDSGILKDGVLTFNVITEFTETNPQNGAVLYITTVDKAEAVKQ